MKAPVIGTFVNTFAGPVHKDNNKSYLNFRDTYHYIHSSVVKHIDLHMYIHYSLDQAQNVFILLLMLIDPS